MIRRELLRTLAALLAGLAVAACGKRGELELPPPPEDDDEETQ